MKEPSLLTGLKAWDKLFWFTALKCIYFGGKKGALTYETKRRACLGRKIG